MKSFSTLLNRYIDLSQNGSATNYARGIELMNDQHRYLIQKYFDNERSYYTTTIGAQSLTTTATLSAGDTSATLSSAWTYATCVQGVSFSNSDQRQVTFTNGSTSISWDVGLSATATTAITTIGVQAYPIPAQVSKIINDTITIGQLRYRPAPIMTRAEWDLINTLPYTSDIPNYFFIYNRTVQFWPIPSTTGNIITFNYKSRVPDFSTAFLFSSTAGAAYAAGSTTYDYQVGSLATITNGSDAITGTSTSWNTTGKFPLVNVEAFNLYLTINPPNGDGLYYPIQKFTTDTALSLLTPIQNAPASSTAANGYSIGQYPLLQEDFHDMLYEGALMTYFSTIKKDPDQYKLFSEMYNARLGLLEAYVGNKSVNVDLGAQETPRNPNLYNYASGSVGTP